MILYSVSSRGKRLYFAADTRDGKISTGMYAPLTWLVSCVTKLTETFLDNIKSG